MALTHSRYLQAVAPLDFEWTFPALSWWPGVDQMLGDDQGRHLLRVEEFEQDGTLVIRAEMPGIDPDKDVEIEVAAGVLTIRAERREEKAETSERNFHRNEIRYGSFSRSLALQEGTKESDIRASYKDGVLEIRVPVPEVENTETTRVPIARI